MELRNTRRIEDDILNLVLSLKNRNRVKISKNDFISFKNHFKLISQIIGVDSYVVVDSHTNDLLETTIEVELIAE